ncbi:MAG: helix-turn-helix domain-containing protein [Actinomycetota bacterium]|nr:helix-turn-helix domain-containing protein [Actinomycetota bacterium]
MSDDDGALRDWPLGAVLLDARTRAGWSQVELAKRSGVSHTKIGQLERGYTVVAGERHAVGTSKKTVQSVARALGLDVTEALAMIGITNPDPGASGRRTVSVDLSEVSDEDLAAEVRRRLTLPRLAD